MSQAEGLAPCSMLLHTHRLRTEAASKETHGSMYSCTLISVLPCCCCCCRCPAAAAAAALLLLLPLLLQIRDLVGRSAKRDHLRQLQRMHHIADVLPHQLFIIENITQLTGHYIAYGARPGECREGSCEELCAHPFLVIPSAYPDAAEGSVQSDAALGELWRLNHNIHNRRQFLLPSAPAPAFQKNSK